MDKKEEKKGLAKWYVAASDEGKIAFWLLAVDLFGALVFVPFCILSLPGLLYGWLFGCLIEFICCFTMIKGASMLVDLSSERGTRDKGIALTLGFAAFRFLLVGGALVLAAFLTFKVEGNWINFFTTAGAFAPLIVVSIVFTLIHNREKKKASPKEEKKPAPLEKGEEAIDE